MKIVTQWIQRGVLCGLLLGGVVGCSMVASPPTQIAPTDHAALATWYDNEAAQLRQKAKDMEVMLRRYAENPHLAHIEGKQNPSKVQSTVDHCNALIGIYTKAAEEADALSRVHRNMMK